MNIFKSSVVLVVIATAVCVAANAPVAVRVEAESLAVTAEGTRVALTIQVSPEDRSRIGNNAMVRIALDGGVPPGQSPLWAVRIENDGSGRIETVWPPGEHSLRVEISNPSGQDSGLWVGTVRIPGATGETSAPDDRAEPPKPTPVPTPAAAIDEAVAAEVTATAPEAPAAVEEDVQEIIEETVEVTDALDEAPPAVTTPEVEEVQASVPAPEPPPERVVVVDDEIVPDVEPAPPEAAPAAEPVPETAAENEKELGASAPAIAAGATGATAAAAPEANIEVAPEPVAPTDHGAPAVPEPRVAEPEPPVMEPEAAVVEPLRSEAVPPSAVPAPEAAPVPRAKGDSPAPPPAEVSAAFEEWAGAASGTVDLTVVAFRDGEPATGLTAADFRLLVDRKETVVEAVGDAERAPLQLGVVVDVAAGSAAGWSQSGGRLFPLVERARGGRGHAFFAADGRIGAWDGGPGGARGGPGAVNSGDLASLIVDSLGRFEGRRGRSFLVLVTDGRSDADKAAWKAATDAAANTGVPVLVIALWDDNFGDRMRKNLKGIAEVSGGGLFLVQGSDQLDRAAERFGPVIDAGVALRFALPSSVTLPAAVSVAPTDKTLEVTAPKGVR